MIVRGYYGSEPFEYVKLQVTGCVLGDECASESEIRGKSFNFINLQVQPAFLEREEDQNYRISGDTTYLKYLDPAVTQASNIWLKQSKISVNENVFDILKNSDTLTEIL